MVRKLTREQRKAVETILLESGMMAWNRREYFLRNAGLETLIPTLPMGEAERFFADALIQECERVGAPPTLGEDATVLLLRALQEERSGNPDTVAALAEIMAGIETNHAEQHVSPPPIKNPVPSNPTKTKILFLSANSVEFPQLRLDIEMRNLGEELRMSHHRDQFDLQLALAVRTGDLTGHLLRHRPSIVHFAGHGVQAEGIVMLDENNASIAVKPEVLANPFTRSAIIANLSCVLFNACWSDAQAQALATIAKIPYVIGMTTQIPDKAARAFTIGFYRALGDGLTIPEAYEFGCSEMTLRMNDTAYENMARLLEGKER